MIRRLGSRLTVAAAVVTVAVLGGVGVAWAAFTSVPSASAPYATATVSPPTLLAPVCGLTRGIGSVTLTWTPTTFTLATGYQIYRSANGGAFAPLASIAGTSPTSYVDTVATNLGTLTYRMVTVAGFSQTTWTSGPSATVTC